MLSHAKKQKTEASFLSGLYSRTKTQTGFPTLT